MKDNVDDVRLLVVSHLCVHHSLTKASART